jgi:hypothetical protein
VTVLIAAVAALAGDARMRGRWSTIAPLGVVLVVLPMSDLASPFAPSLLLSGALVARAAFALLGGGRVAGALRGVVGGRMALPRSITRIAAAASGPDAVYERSIVPALRSTAALVERGGEEVIAATETALVRLGVRASIAASSLQRGSIWAHEALLLAAAVVIVAYWIAR